LGHWENARRSPAGGPQHPSTGGLPLLLLEPAELPWDDDKPIIDDGVNDDPPPSDDDPTGPLLPPPLLGVALEPSPPPLEDEPPEDVAGRSGHPRHAMATTNNTPTREIDMHVN
jgi:hypothetical protein